MGGKTRTVYMGGEGTVRMAGLKGKGLRNKRKSYWASLRKAELMEKERREKRRERAEQFDYAPAYDY